MLELKLSDDEGYIVVRLEHSLVSLSKWESFYEKPFYGKTEKTSEEMLAYIAYMVVDETPPENFPGRLELEELQKIGEYINSKQSATWFQQPSEGRGSNEVITNEMIYYWLVQFQIPFTPCETWHLNRLMTLVKIAGIKQTKPKKMSRTEQAEQFRRLNAERKAQLGTSG